MAQTDRRQHAEMGAHIGSASILMIFAVLCLTIFAALSFETASYEQRLAQKAALATQHYYVADGIAEERYLQICELFARNLETDALEEQLNALEVKIIKDAQEMKLYYTVPIDDTQELQVVLLEKNGVLRTLAWNAAAIAQWEYDDNLQVWDGD